MPQPPKKAAPTKRPAKKKASAQSRKPPQIVPIGQGSSQYLRMLVYGPPGTGKTRFLGSAPNSLMLEADQGGDASAALSGSTADKWELKDWNDQADAIGYLQHGGAREYEFVTLDTITMFQDSGLVNIMDDLHAQKPNRAVWLPDKGEYGQNMNRVLRFVRDLVALPCHVIVAAHVLESVDH
nr:AAA family ATPase [Anaerolineae bacterium]NIN95678.1 AAA family ATPase [Anaerolineae bacterium]